VCRIINNDEAPNLDAIQLPEHAKADIKTALRQTQGLFLVTGPTGSGKSTTLQACIASIPANSKKIISIENPPERILPGVVHECITPRYGWKDAIKGAMREDPDIILVGEIRDEESAKLAIEAAQTGHLVLSTLHTNNVPATVTRLLTLGVEKHLIADALVFVSAQRLLKVLCPECKLPEAGLWKKNPAGCTACGTGYAGRVPILEYCLSPDPDLVFNFDQKVFSRALRQDLASETRRFVALGEVDYRLLPAEETSNIVAIRPREEACL
jgi:general secretion pathway protein E